MKITGIEIRIGNILEFEGKLWRVLKTQHTKPGKGGAYMQVELKDIRIGTKLNQRFRSSETVERVRLDQSDFNYLYNDGTSYTFMNNETYEQITVDEDFIGDATIYLQENMQVKIDFYESEPISVTLPETVVLAVAEADAVIKGQTAASSYKPAVMENGVRTNVPPHIATGDRLVISTLDGSYVERAKD